MASCSRRISHLFGLAAALVALLSLVLACEASGSTVPRNGAGFVRTQGPRFVLNGSPFLFNGFNSYWLMHVAADPKERYKVSEVLRDASAAGLSVCRTWAFGDGGDRALQISPGIYDERVFQVHYCFFFSFPSTSIFVLQLASLIRILVYVVYTGAGFCDF